MGILMEDKTALSITAIACITVLEAMAIANGIDGVAFATALSLIAGIAGYQVKAVKK
jgi:hypothetical protein